MYEITTIARPYAKAAFDFAIEKKMVNKWQNMLTFISKIICNKQINNIIYSSISSKILAKILINICGNKIDKHVRNLIYIMAENKRLNALSEVLKQFIQLRNILELTANVNVISSIKLTNKQKIKISIMMKKRLLCKKIKLNCKIDKSIIAGIIIHVGDLVIDGSVSGHIEYLTYVLQS
ncbi:MAG: F0F1 ATP synthase subunit delta [Arsenophonus endosymbiont of Ceratovacuna japonica]